MSESLIEVFAGIGIVALIVFAVFICFKVYEYFDNINYEIAKLNNKVPYNTAYLLSWLDEKVEAESKARAKLEKKLDETTKDHCKLADDCRTLSISVRDKSLKFLELVKCVEETVKNQIELEKKLDEMIPEDTIKETPIDEIMAIIREAMDKKYPVKK